MLLQDGIELQSFVDHFSQRYDVKYFIECLKSNVLISHHNERERERERERETLVASCQTVAHDWQLGSGRSNGRPAVGWWVGLWVVVGGGTFSVRHILF